MWSSEIEKFPLKLTSIRFPQTKQLGDVTKMSADEIKPVDIITMGSPCQDLSIAGKRKGLAGERSGLFVTAVKLVHSMRKITNGKYPKYAVWENVTGAFSSNKGMDFKSVLEAFTKPVFQYLDTENGQNQGWLEAESVQSSGEHWTPSIGESPSIDVESSLLQILQPGVVQKKYFLSPKACRGILRRAAKIGKKLPVRLEQVLMYQASLR